MSNGVRFPTNSVLDWYIEAEQMLADFLEYVPFCDTHKEVWSPKLVIVLQEACSQLDSLWRWEAINDQRRNDMDVDIAGYFELYGSQIAPRWVIFWADKPEKVQPFSEWQETQYHPLDWWTEGYNKVKHNRLENRTRASLKRTVEAIAGLFLAIVRSEHCWDTLWEKHWMSWSDDTSPSPFDPFDCLRADFEQRNNNRGQCAVTHMAIESKLFTYPVGLCTGLITADKHCPHWRGNCSRRFKTWYYDYCQDF